MLIEPVAYIAAACLIFAAGLGTRELVEWVRGEIAFSRAIRGRLDAFAVRWQEQTGQAWGPIGNVPDHVANPAWLRADAEPPVDPAEYQPAAPARDEELPADDEDGYPRDEQRMQAGAWRRETVRGNSQMAAWPVNDDTGRHRRVKPRGDDTRQFSPVEVLDAAGVGGAS